MAQQKDASPYYEEQALNKWVYAALFVLTLVIYLFLYRDVIAHLVKLAPFNHGISSITVAWILLTVCAVLVVPNILGMSTAVNGKFLVVRLGRFFTYSRRRIPLSEIASAEVVTFSRFELGYEGYGIRKLGKGFRAYFLLGNRGVRLVLQNGDHLLIGSRQPEALIAAIRG